METIGEDDSEYDASLTREKLVTERKIVDGVWKNLEVLITDEGFGVKAVKNNKGVVVSYEYATVENDGYLYRVRYNNDGTSEMEGEPFGEVTPDEEGSDN